MTTITTLQNSMNVRIIVGAERAYAAIQTPTRSMDVELSAGMSASQSLRERAQELRAKIERLESQSRLMDAAAELLQTK